MITKTEVIK